MTYAAFDELPNQVKVWLRQTGQPNLSEWVKVRIPALKNRSILEVASEPDGERELAQFCAHFKVGFP